MTSKNHRILQTSCTEKLTEYLGSTRRTSLSASYTIRARMGLGLQDERLRTAFAQKYRSRLFDYHWVLPYRCGNALLQTSKTGGGEANVAYDDGGGKGWQWGRKGWETGYQAGCRESWGGMSSNWSSGSSSEKACQAGRTGPGSRIGDRWGE